MRERPDISRELPYFGHDELIGNVVLAGEPYGLRLKLHESEERLRGHREIFPVRSRTGTRRYFHAKPYVLEPQITLTVDLSPAHRPDGAIGAVAGSTWEGMRHREIGQAQAWYYPADRVLVIWECFLLGPYREPEPVRDMSHLTLWTGFERALLGRLPEAERLVTTWEDIYPREQWADFLTARGYAAEGGAVFAKPVGGRRGGPS